jgi:hypothetical protein
MWLSDDIHIPQVFFRVLRLMPSYDTFELHCFPPTSR